jgi:heat shock protein HtpX
MNQGTARKLPEWDSRGVAEPYLRALREEAHQGRFDASNVDALMTSLVKELRETYDSQNVERALEGLSRILQHIERLATEANVQSYMPQSEPAVGLESSRSAGSAKSPLKGVIESRLPATNAGQERQLNAGALRKSLLPTWLGLVVTSWFGLIWGALITLPFGIGLAVFASMFAGVFVVPLWATVIGLLGMGAASDGTLRQMRFKPLDKSDPLREQANRYAAQLGIPTPKLGHISVFNAFAMGGSVHSATVAIGEPLRKALSPAEVNAVLAHELGHVVSGDMCRMTFMRTFQNATVWYMFFNGAKQFARWMLSWVAELWILGFSRNREYWADAVGAELAGKDAMIGALRKLESAPALSGAEDTHARFMFRGRFSGLLNTHPSTDERIQALLHETYLKRLPRRHG